jgi:hypothetical protein
VIRDQVLEVLRSNVEQRRHSRRFRHYLNQTNRYSIFEGMGSVINPDGSIAWADPEPVPNALTNTGQTDMLATYLKAQAATTTFGLGLFTAASGGSAPAKTNVSADIILTGTATATQLFEEQGGGYARQSVTNANWGTPALNSGDEMSTAAQKTFGPVTTAAWTGSTGTSAAITYAFLSTSTSVGTGGVLILYVALSASTVVAVGQSFNYTLNFKQQ